jgi:mannose-6-phosphate isomerase-like protein (cupin superfamily)
MRIRFLLDPVPVLVVPVGGDKKFPWGETPESLDISIHGVGNNWLVRNHFKKTGQWGFGHWHYHDHLMLLTSGSVEVSANGLLSRYEADHIIIIPKQTRHQIRALRDDTTIWCIAALRDGETGEVIGADDQVESLQPMTEELATALGELHVPVAAQTT